MKRIVAVGAKRDDMFKDEIRQMSDGAVRQADLPRTVVETPAGAEVDRGMVFNVMRYCLHDGPGIRTVVFLKGCPLRCAWCHNPEGIERHAEIAFIESRCILCGECLDACPEGAVQKDGERYVIADDRCIRCGTCIETCYADARQLVGKEMSVHDVLFEVGKDRVYYEESGGGVTFSGGEPLMQHRFLLALLQESRRRGLHTAIETSGYCSPEILERIARHADLILYDVKVIDEERHRLFTGVSNALILENLRRLSSRGANVVVRIPVVPGVNDDEQSFQALGEFLCADTSVRDVHLLPFHRIGTDKYRRLRKDHGIPDFGSLPRAVLEVRAAHLSAFGLNVRIGG
ncbi:MAG TPA: glycyl-radical enzyme activating protein [Bacteroidota bacterium]